MFHLATSELTHFLTAYGYWAVLLFVAIESTGIPFPGETMLLVAAIYARMTQRLSLPLVIMAGPLGPVWAIIWATGWGAKATAVCWHYGTIHPGMNLTVIVQ